MSVLSQELMAHLGGEVTTLATCWRVKRRDGVVMGFTTHDETLVIDGLQYRPSSAFTPSGVSSHQLFEADDLEIEGALSDSTIQGDDLRAGVYDFAELELFMVNWRDLGAGVIKVKSGWIGEVKLLGGRFLAEFRGLTRALEQAYGHVYSAECSADLGDMRCQVDLDAHRLTGVVTGVTNRRVFQDENLSVSDGLYDYGRLRWLTGINSGRGMEIKNQLGQEIGLFDSMGGDIAIGDRFEMWPGCDKRFETCRVRFGNGINYRGHPHVPGMDAVLNYPGIA